jgi:septum site-determining protein MinC
MDKPCFELKGSIFTLTVLQLFADDLDLLETQLAEKVKMAPKFFNSTPLVIDLHLLPEKQQNHLDFYALRELLLAHSIIPVGVKGAPNSLNTVIEAAGLGALAEAHQAKKPAPPALTPTTDTGIKPGDADKKASEPQMITVTKYQKPKIFRQTIRSGRQIYAPNGDLIIIGSVSAGAEILADGHIHVYGALRGRALAGIKGDQSASIFCQAMQAELYSIAGIYLLSEDIPQDKINQAVEISLIDEKLQMKSLTPELRVFNPTPIEPLTPNK